MKRLDPNGISPADLGLLLAQLMETDPHHPLVLAARLALEIGDRRVRTPVYADDYIDGRYHRQNVLPEYTELQKRRYPPHGNRDEWVKARAGDWKGTETTEDDLDHPFIKRLADAGLYPHTPEAAA